MKRNCGFTLIELMIVVAVVAVLVALAVPAYNDWVRKANRGEAQSLLINWANNQEVWRAGDTDYATTAELPVPTHPRYTFTLQARGTNNYTLRATPNSVGGQSTDREGSTTCNPLEINQTQLKTPAACWRE